MTTPPPDLSTTYAAFGDLSTAISALPEAERLSLQGQLGALADSLNRHAREVDQKLTISRVLFALAAKHWRGYTSQHTTPAHRNAAGEHMHKLMGELEQDAKRHPHRLSGAEQYDFRNWLK